MFKNLVFIVSLMYVLGCTNQVVGDEKKLPPIFSSDVQKEIMSINIPLSDSKVVSGIAELSSKGNGTLQLGNLLIRTYDQHDDGLVYKNRELAINLKDLTGNGNYEFILSGVLTFTGETESDLVIYQSLVEIITLNCQTRKFELLFNSGNYSSILSKDGSISTEC